MGLTPWQIESTSKQLQAPQRSLMWLHGSLQPDWFWVSGPASATTFQLGSSFPVPRGLEEQLWSGEHRDITGDDAMVWPPAQADTWQACVASAKVLPGTLSLPPPSSPARQANRGLWGRNNHKIYNLAQDRGQNFVCDTHHTTPSSTPTPHPDLDWSIYATKQDLSGKTKL